MNRDDILRGLHDETLVGNAPSVLELPRKGLDAGPAAETTLLDALIPSLEQVGARFERGEVLRAEDAGRGPGRSPQEHRHAQRARRPEPGEHHAGGAGFPVIDLSVRVSPEKVDAGILENEPGIVGFSAFLTTMPMFKADTEHAAEGGPARPGGRHARRRPVTEENADAGGADGNAADATAGLLWNLLTTLRNLPRRGIP